MVQAVAHPGGRDRRWPPVGAPVEWAGATKGGPAAALHSPSSITRVGRDPETGRLVRIERPIPAGTGRGWTDPTG